VTLEVEGRCRQCPQCLRTRAALWRGRARSEIADAPGRTWFGTLTLTPHWQFRAKCEARSMYARRGGVDFDRVPAKEQFTVLCRIIGREVTLYLKRLRKNSGARIRYVLVFEAHKSGDPHMHILLHEADVPLRHKLLADQWRLGFSKFNLVQDTRAAAYVCKYLSKSAIARIRASVNYGASYVYSENKHLGLTNHSENLNVKTLTIPKHTTEKESGRILSDDIPGSLPERGLAPTNNAGAGLSKAPGERAAIAAAFARSAAASAARDGARFAGIRNLPTEETTPAALWYERHADAANVPR